MDNKKSNSVEKILNLPIKGVVIYLFSTVFLYFFGPIKWRIDNHFLLAGYLILSYLFILAGYRMYYKKNTFRMHAMNSNENAEYRYDKWFTFISILSIVSHLVYSAYYFTGISLNVLFSFGSVYYENLYREVHTNAITKILTYLWGINYLYLPWGIVIYKRLKLYDKIIFWVAVAMNALFWLSIGTMKGIGDIVILSVLPYIATTLNRGKNNVSINQNMRKRLFAIILLVVLFAVIFGVSQQSRYEFYNKTLTTYSTNRFVESQVLWPFPYLTNRLISYITHGYTGLAYALKLPFEWTYFIGNSRALTDIVERHIIHSTVISSSIYPQRLEEAFGWSNGISWPSAFTWLASDFSFIFLPLVLMLISYFWAKCICDAFIEKNISALALASYLMLFFVFLPCNNQIVQSERSLWTLILLVFLYWRSKSKIKLSFGGKILPF